METTPSDQRFLNSEEEYQRGLSLPPLSEHEKLALGLPPIMENLTLYHIQRGLDTVGYWHRHEMDERCPIFACDESAFVLYGLIIEGFVKADYQRLFQGSRGSECIELRGARQTEKGKALAARVDELRLVIDEAPPENV